MAVITNELGEFMPHHEARRMGSPTTLDTNGATAEFPVSGDSNAIIYMDGGGVAFNGTYVLEYTPDDANWFPLPGYAFPPGCNAGTIPSAAQPLLTESFTQANIKRTLLVACGQVRGIRVRLTAWTAGALDVLIATDSCDSLSPYLRDQKAATLAVTNTGAASAAVSVSLPAVAGLRHYVDRVSVVRSASVALTAAAVPVLVTTTNLPGSPVLTFGADAAAQGTDKEMLLEYGASGLSAIAIGTATTIVCPVATGVIWRINVSYRLGL